MPCTAGALDAIVLEAEELAGSGWRARALSARLELPGTGRSTASLHVGRLAASPAAPPVDELSIVCPDLLAREALLACRSARVALRVPELGMLRLRASGEFRSDRGTYALQATDLSLAGGRLGLSAHGDARGWSAEGRGEGWTLAKLRDFARRWVEIPASIDFNGTLAARFQAQGRPATRGGAASPQIEVEVKANLSGLNLANEDGTLAAENLAASAAASFALGGARDALELRLASGSGQALAGPVLLDLAANPLALRARGRRAGGRIVLESLELAQRGLLRAHGSGTLSLGASPGIEQARLTVEELLFPAAYKSFLQLPLAATDFAALQTSGRARGEVRLANNAVAGLDVTLEGVELAGPRISFFLRDLNGRLHWTSDASGAVEPSHLAWSGGGAYGLSGGAARLDFLARGRGFSLLKPARLPVFDGAVAIGALAVEGVGTEQAALDFEAEIEPISMPLLCAAFGWPQFSGQLAGRIPALGYRHRTLQVSGDIVAEVFGGTIVGSNFRLQDPLGRWPRLFADVRARNLDLELVTRTFPIGTITGRLEGHVLGLELFAWSPVAFDALLRTPPQDRSPHRISARAVGNLANIGGGGGNVMQALQSGVLRFFDDYRYDELGIRCRLRDEVCLMGGIEPAGIGYYIVKGRGLPRIDIIGNQGRVNWPQLVSQIVAAMRSEEVLVR